MQIEDTYFDSLLTRLDWMAKGGKTGELTIVERLAAAPGSDGAQLAGQGVSRDPGAAESQPKQPAASRSDAAEFVPVAPKTLDEAGVCETLLETLILKLLLHRSTVAGRAIADHIGLPFGLVESVLGRLKTEQLIVYRNSTALGDFQYQLTDKGVASAHRALAQLRYFGAAPVTFEDYLASVKAQSINRRRPKMADIVAAFADMELDPMLLNQLGQAMDAGRGFFLYGSPGNGKTSIAERVSQVFGQYIWIPRTLVVNGQLIRLFDSCAHQEVPLEAAEMQGIDRRWVRIRRPAIVVGGELVFESLDLAPGKDAGVCEAPLQLKSNCGTLVIDDFGRQRVSTDQILNRWIIPLDRGHDFLNLPGGQSLRVPFDQLLVFSTNLEPRELVDEAFLRRIPYKIEVRDPAEDEFHRLLVKYAAKFEVAYDRSACDYLVERHFRQTGRVLRRCHARDLIAQIHHFCQFNEVPSAMTPKNFDLAALNYFVLHEAN